MIRPSPELEAVTRRWVTGFGARDMKASTNLFSDSDALTYMGSADGENWKGDALRTGFAGYVGEFPAFIVDEIDVAAFETDAVGWAVWTAEVTTADTDKRIKFRGTIVYALENAVWRIVQVHNSNPVSNLELMEFEPQKFDELVRAAADSLLTEDLASVASVMFTDIADSSTLAEALGDSAWSKVVSNHLQQLRELIARAKGTLVKSLGDGSFSTFSTAEDALSAAQAIQRQTKAGKTEPRLRLRIGIHTGKVIQTADDFLGTVVNKAARIAATANPGDIRVSDTTRLMVGGDGEFVFRDRASILQRGLEGEHVIHHLEWQS